MRESLFFRLAHPADFKVFLWTSLDSTEFSLAVSARLMPVKHRPGSQERPKPAPSPESRRPQGLEIPVISIDGHTCGYACGPWYSFRCIARTVPCRPIHVVSGNLRRHSIKNRAGLRRSCLSTCPAPAFIGSSAPALWASVRRHWAAPAASDDA